MRGGVAIVAGLFALVVQPVYARAPGGDESQVQSFMKSDFYGHLLDDALASLPETVFRKCPTLVSEGAGVTVLTPISFAAAALPIAGSWKQTYPIAGCGNNTVLNFYFSVGAGGRIDTVIGVPGATRADPVVQKEARRRAHGGAAVIVRDCETFDVTNTAFNGFGVIKRPINDPGPYNLPRPWWEIWTIVGCGRTVDVPIKFIPRDYGTQIVQPNGAVER